MAQRGYREGNAGLGEHTEGVSIFFFREDLILPSSVINSS